MRRKKHGYGDGKKSLNLKIRLKGEIMKVVCSFKFIVNYSDAEVFSSVVVRIRVGKGRQTFGAMERMCSFSGVKSDVRMGPQQKSCCPSSDA